jgi:hypothetical protein
MQLWQTTKSVIKDIITEKDGQSIHNSKFMALIGFVVFIGCEIYNTVRNHSFDAIAFGTCLSAIIAATGASVRLQQGTEQSVTTTTTGV